MNLTVKFGIDILLNNAQAYQNTNIGLVCNIASVTNTGTHARLALKQAGFNIVKLFAPEHGFDAKGVDGAFINHQIDAQTQIPIVSLYGENLSPTADDLADLDLIIIDLPDIGARFYTYLWTMTYVMEACQKANKPVLVLDRPNPMAHDLALAEGPNLSESCASFIGRFDIPITHHCTFGELASYFQTKYYPKLNLNIIKMEGWDRQTNQGYNFFPTSPAIQKRDTVYTYPGACLFEGLNINEGRETPYPFQQFGAPWIDAEQLKNIVKNHLPQATVKTVTYTPTISQYQGQQCYGLCIFPKNPSTFQAISYFTKIIYLINQIFPNQLAERHYLTNVNPTGTKHLDMLLGLPNSFSHLCQGDLTTTLTENWPAQMKQFLLY